MKYFFRKNIIILLLFLLVAGVGGYLWYRHQTDPNNIKRTYSLDSYPKFKGKAEYQEHIDILNKDVQVLSQASTTSDTVLQYDTWIDIGVRKLALEDYRGAEAAWKKAVPINPKNPLAYANLANLYKSFLKDYPQSEHYYQLAIAQNVTAEPYFPDYDGLADLYTNYYTEHASEVEVLMLSGLDKAQVAQNRVGFLIYLTNYYKTRDQEKYSFYRQQALSIDPSIESQLP